MLVGPNTTADQVKAEITKLSKKASRLPRASDEWVRHHADIYRLQGLLDGLLKRERRESA